MSAYTYTYRPGLILVLEFQVWICNLNCLTDNNALSSV